MYGSRHANRKDFLPSVADRLESYQVLNTNIPIAVLTWVMIFPMMMKIDFKSILNVRKNISGDYDL